MVSRITTGYTTDSKGRPFLRRNATPALIVVTVLAVLAAAAWIFTFSLGEEDSHPTDCNLADGASLAPASAESMLPVTPAPLAGFRVRVLNAAADRGSAQSVSEDLAQYGFRGGDPAYADDEQYPDRDLHCVAQIRFGDDGLGSAAALWIAEPCAQLVNDGREGADVDLALGEFYRPTVPTQDAQAALEALRVAVPNQKQAAVDASLVAAVHDTGC